MTCHCGKTALYIAGTKGFCGEHKAEAVARMKYSTREILVQNRRELGTCIDCGVPCEGWRCSLHNRKSNAASMKSYHNRKAKA